MIVRTIVKGGLKERMKQRAMKKEKQGIDYE